MSGQKGLLKAITLFSTDKNYLVQKKRDVNSFDVIYII